MDSEISQNLKMILKKKGVEFHTGTMVKKISEGSQGALDCVCQEKDNRMCITADRILVAVGRQPNTLNLFSESMDISMEQGYVSVNENFRPAIIIFMLLGMSLEAGCLPMRPPPRD